MLRSVFTVSRLISRPLLTSATTTLRNTAVSPPINQVTARNFTSIIPQCAPKPKLLTDPRLIQISNNIITRNIVKYSFRKGKRKSNKAVIRRFYRLNWGGWIRTKCGRHKKLWKKSPPRKRRLRQHVLCNATQSTLLDKMAGAYWRRPKYYVDDPYEPYHTREEFQFTAKKPRPYFPPEK